MSVDRINNDPSQLARNSGFYHTGSISYSSVGVESVPRTSHHPGKTRSYGPEAFNCPLQEARSQLGPCTFLDSDNIEPVAASIWWGLRNCETHPIKPQLLSPAFPQSMTLTGKYVASIIQDRYQSCQKQVLVGKVGYTKTTQYKDHRSALAKFNCQL